MIYTCHRCGRIRTQKHLPSGWEEMEQLIDWRVSEETRLIHECPSCIHEEALADTNLLVGCRDYPGGRC